MSAPRICAVVVTYCNAELLGPCIRSLYAQRLAPVEVIVVDNGGFADTEAVVRAEGARLLRPGANLGLGPGFNAGARAAAPCDQYFFCNDDLRLDEGCLQALAAALAAPDVFASEPRHRSLDGRQVTHGAVRLRLDLRNRNLSIPFTRAVEDRESSGTQETLWPCGGAMLVDRAKLEALGGFDDTFWLYYEDVDLGWRAGLQGWKTLHVPRALLYHEVGASHGPKLLRRLPPEEQTKVGRVDLRILRSHERNAQRFLLKTQPAPVCAAGLGLQVLRFGLSLARGRREVAGAIGRAWVGNLLAMGSLARERRRLRRSAVVAPATLLRRFLRPAGSAFR